MKTSELIGPALDWAVRILVEKVDIGCPANVPLAVEFLLMREAGDSFLMPSEDWSQGGPIIERENITTIRADDDYEVDGEGFTTSKRIPQWFAECSRWTGHSLTTSYEGENMEPTFMVGEDGGYYGPTPLIAAMRCYVASKLGDEVEIPLKIC